VRALQGRYDDDRSLRVEPGINHEVAVRLDNQEPLYLDALDLAFLVNDAVQVVWGFSEQGDRKPDESQTRDLGGDGL
jgi:hypothetical protein